MSAIIIEEPSVLSGIGVGLRSCHYAEVLNNKTSISWFEAISENYMGILKMKDGGRPLQILELVRKNYPVVLHGVSLNIGSTDPLNLNYLKKLNKLIKRVQPVLVSDHFCWTGVDGENLHDLLPLPFTEEAVKHVSARIEKCQDYLKHQLIFENLSSYFTFNHSEMTEWEFISEIAIKTGCGILLDVNNIYVNSINNGFNAELYLKKIPKSAVAQIHLAGHANMGTHLIDTHDREVAPEVWSLYRSATKIFGIIPTMVEWDADIPDFATLQAEALKAKTIQEEEYACFRKNKNTFKSSSARAEMHHY